MASIKHYMSETRLKKTGLIEHKCKTKAEEYLTFSDSIHQWKYYFPPDRNLTDYIALAYLIKPSWKVNGLFLDNHLRRPPMD